jgi:hypothetical protein
MPNIIKNNMLMTSTLTTLKIAFDRALTAMLKAWIHVMNLRGRRILNSLKTLIMLTSKFSITMESTYTGVRVGVKFKILS